MCGRGVGGVPTLQHPRRARQGACQRRAQGPPTSTHQRLQRSKPGVWEEKRERGAWACTKKGAAAVRQAGEKSRAQLAFSPLVQHLLVATALWARGYGGGRQTTPCGVCDVRGKEEGSPPCFNSQNPLATPPREERGIHLTRPAGHGAPRPTGPVVPCRAWVHTSAASPLHTRTSHTT